ncbi:acyl carrier protein [Streptomyces sp. NPDC058385]|uniref:acyl carrier protein n=1 Tax=Streptomyces sp. NPDC058385 TaxID=3346473 RepID=UPI00365E7373
MAALDEITKVIAEIIEEYTGIPASDIDHGKAFSSDLGIDEPTMNEILNGIEEHCDVKIAGTDSKKFTTVGDAVHHIYTHRKSTTRD